MKTFKIKTLGCKVNQYESEGIIEDMIAAGFKLSTSSITSDLVIINTCAVTEKASMRSRQVIRKAVRDNSNSKLLVTGCYSQISHEDIKKITGINCIIANNCKHKIIKNMNLSSKGYIKNDIFFSNSSISNNLKRTRPFIKIQDGCNSCCTYCIVPHARGKSKSLPENRIIKKINYLKTMGYKEVVLTGIHIGKYGKDLNNRSNLYKLLRKIIHNESINRIRISSIEPRELSDDIIYLTKNTNKNSRICQHFHIPLQSGDDFILNGMNRPYNVDYFRKLIKKILWLIPNCAIGLDVMIGFPGETNTAFNNTYNLIKELKIAYLHIFPFSPRRGTPAWNYSNKISSKIIKERCNKIRKLDIQKQMLFRQKFLNKTVSILVENRKNNCGKLIGFSENYIPVQFDGPESMYNTIQHVNITKITKKKYVEGALLS